VYVHFQIFSYCLLILKVSYRLAIQDIRTWILKMNEQTVYVTKSKVSQILQSVDLYRTNIAYEGLYEKNLADILSKPELKLLALYRDILNNPEKITLDHYVKKEFKDSKRYIYENINPSYHSSPDCERLSARFENYEVPAEIQERGNEEVDKFRAFFKENIRLFETNHDAFAFRAHALFKLQNAPRKVEYSNSGVETFFNGSSQELETLIDELLTRMYAFRTANVEHSAEIRKFGFATHKAKAILKGDKATRKINQPNSIIAQWHAYKIQLKQLLRDYFRARFNPDFAFDQNLLEQLGFRPCASCCNKMNN